MKTLFVNFLHIFLILILLLTCFAPSKSMASNESNEARLENVKAALSNETSQQNKLEKRMEKIESELLKIKNRLTSIGRSMRKNEDKLKDTQNRIDTLEKEKAELAKTLETERVSIVKLILMLGRIRKTPPEAMLARPDSPYHTAQSALLMENIIPSIKHDLRKLMNNLEILNKLGDDLADEQEERRKQTRHWDKKRKKLASLLEQKEKLHSKVDKDIKARQLSINAISLRAKSLEELISEIKTEERREIARQKQSKIFRRKPSWYKKKAFSHRENEKVQLPVSGIIRTSYLGKDEYGAKSNGLIIEARSGGLVTAPMSGKIQFVGSFKRYSKIVIIEHSDGFHSLIAGLEEINAVIGDIVRSGEPIGLLPNSALIPRPKLYYELRKDGIPVNPSVKFLELG